MKYLLYSLVIILFSACNTGQELTRANCRMQYPCPEVEPSVIIDSTFVVDTVVVIDSIFTAYTDTVEMKDSIIKTKYEDKNIKADIDLKLLNDGSYEVNTKVTQKERSHNVKQADVQKLKTTVLNLGQSLSETDSLNQELELELIDISHELRKTKSNLASEKQNNTHKSIMWIVLGVATVTAGGIYLMRKT